MVNLVIDELRAGYGRLEVIHSIALRVGEGEIVALIGANGAGKTTLLRAISSMGPWHRGAIKFDEKSIDELRADQIVRRGIVHVPQGRSLFGDLSVAENLELGAYSVPDKRRRRDFGAVFELFPTLASRQGEIVDRLSGGQQQMVAIGRALMASPRLLILDEPTIGLAPNLVAEVYGALAKIRHEGVAIFLVEQNAVETLQIADRGYVLESGIVTSSGSGAQLLSDESIRRAYLGI